MKAVLVLGGAAVAALVAGAAMDRSETLSVTDAAETPEGKCEKMQRTLETAPLGPGEKAIKPEAPASGMIPEANLRLVNFGRKG